MTNKNKPDPERDARELAASNARQAAARGLDARDWQGQSGASGGRPSAYTAAIAEAVLDRLASGETLRSICRTKGMPDERTVRGWVKDDREGFAAPFSRAREMGAYAMADEMLEVADDATNDYMERQRQDGSTERVLDHENVARSRLRVETKKWLLAKVLPNVFGDRVAQQMLGRDGAPVDPAGQVLMMDLGDGKGYRTAAEIGEEKFRDG